MANSTTKAMHVQNAKKVFKNYVLMMRQIKALQDEYDAAGMSTGITNEETVFDGVTGAEFKSAIGNLGTAYTTYDGGVDTNIHKVIGSVASDERLRD